MGTVFSIDVRSPDVDRRALEDVVALLHAMDERYSTYRAGSVVSRLADATITLATLEDRDAAFEIGQVLDACERWCRRTDGWFSAYASGRLDPSGYVKGWAIQRASDLLSAAGSTSHLVNGGGDIVTVGDAGGRPWVLGVADPFDAAAAIATISGSALALATSGSAQRGRHVLDPHTGRPAAEDVVSLSVAGRSVVACDVLATAGVAMGERARDFFARRRDVQAFAVHADGSRWSTFA